MQRANNFAVLFFFMVIIIIKEHNYPNFLTKFEAKCSFREYKQQNVVEIKENLSILGVWQGNCITLICSINNQHQRRKSFNMSKR